MSEVKFKLTKELLGLVENKSQYRIKVYSYQTVKQSDEVYDSLVLDFEVVGIVQFPIYDIRPHEPIEIRVYQNELPDVVVLRPDFPTVPHLMIDEYSSEKHICYSDMPYGEILHKLNGFFLLGCINNWFVMTARNELHQPDQPLEPFFPYVRDNIVIGIDYAQEMFCRFHCVHNNDRTTLIQVYHNDPMPETEYYATNRITVKSDKSNIMHSLPNTLKELSDLFPDQNIDNQIKHWLNQLLLIKQNTKEYRRLFDQKSTQLMNCKSVIYLYVPLLRNESKPPESHELKAFVIQSSLSKLMNDYGLRADKSKTTYVPECDNGGKNVKLVSHNIHADFSRRIAQLMNNYTIEECDKNIVQIGAGALGSQLYHNCQREGYGSWTIVDNDEILPHNLARHMLSRDSIGKSKVDSIKHFTELLMPDAKFKPIREDVMSDSNTESIAAFCDADIIVDCSASSGVERFLALDISSDVRRVSFFMNPIGDSTIMLLEDAKRKTTLDLLEMQYYRTLINNSKYTNHFTIPGRISYSGTCRSISSRISQDDVAMSAVLCSKALKQYTKTDDSQIIIWSNDEDNVLADRLQGNPWITLQIDQWRIHLYQPLLDHINENRTKKLPNETGGVLIGSYDCFRKILYVVDTIDPPIDSISSPDSFIRGCKELPERVNEVIVRSADNLYYIGEWHSHPNSITKKSDDDRVLLQTIGEYNRVRCLPGCMIIIGSNQYSVYLSE